MSRYLVLGLLMGLRRNKFGLVFMRSRFIGSGKAHFYHLPIDKKLIWKVTHKLVMFPLWRMPTQWAEPLRVYLRDEFVGKRVRPLPDRVERLYHTDGRRFDCLGEWYFRLLSGGHEK